MHRRGGVPPDDRIPRRNPRDADRQVRWTHVGQRGGHRRDGGFEREGRRAEQAARRDPQLAQRADHQLPLPAPGEEQRRRCVHTRDLPQQRQPFLTRNLRPAGLVREHDDAGAGGRGDRIR